jgi:hypothetical protein
MERNIRRITDTSFRTGLGGISCYIRKRNDSPCRNQQNSPFDETYLSDWEAVKQLTTVPDDNQILYSLLETQPEGENILEWKLGLENGCAGYGLKTIIT